MKAGTLRDNSLALVQMASARPRMQCQRYFAAAGIGRDVTTGKPWR